MKKFLLPSLFLSFFICMPAQASPGFGDNVPRPKRPITLSVEDTPRLSVTFDHRIHEGVTCDTCHHRPRCAICHYAPNEPMAPTASCSTVGCHPDEGRSLNPMSRFNAFHKRDSERSCFGCHVAEGRYNGCQPCHGNPENGK